MNGTFKLLSFCGALMLGTLVAGCSDDKGNDDETGRGGGSSAGGSTSTAGNNGSSGSTSTGPTKLFTFDGDNDGFTLNNAASGDPAYINLAAPGDATVTPPAPTLEVSSKDFIADNPSPGSIKISATYDFWNESVSAEVTAPDKNGVPIDFSKSTVTAQVFVEKGLSPEMDAPGGAVFYIKSGSDYVWGQAPWQNLEHTGQWVQIKFNTEAPDSGTKDGWDPSNPTQIGIQLSSGGGGTHCDQTALRDPAKCPVWTTPLETVIYIDQILVTPND